MSKFLLIIFVILIAKLAHAEILTLDPNKVTVECQDPKPFGDTPTKYRFTTVTTDKVKYQHGDDVRDETGKEVTASCQKAFALKIQIYNAKQENKKIEFDTETFKSNVVGEAETHQVIVDPSKVSVECNSYHIKRILGESKLTTLNVDDTLESKFADDTRDDAGKVTTECQKAKALSEVIDRAKREKNKVIIDFQTKEAKLAYAPKSEGTGTAPIK